MTGTRHVTGPSDEVGAPPVPAAAPGPHAGFSHTVEVAKPWGHEAVFASGENHYVGKLISVRAGESLSLQLHARKDETLVVVSGQALIEHGPSADRLASRTLGPGDTVHLPATVLHRITAVSDLLFAEASTAAPGWREDVVRLGDRYGREGTTTP